MTLSLKPTSLNGLTLNTSYSTPNSSIELDDSLISKSSNLLFLSQTMCDKHLKTKPVDHLMGKKLTENKISSLIYTEEQICSTPTANIKNINRTNDQHHQDNLKSIYCAGCHLPIVDRFYQSVNLQFWHQQCLKCIECGLALVNKCYLKDNLFYCKQDFLK